MKVARKRKMKDSVRVTKKATSEKEERNKENTEGRVEFRRDDCENVRILGSWVGDRVDERNRLRRDGWI